MAVPVDTFPFTSVTVNVIVFGPTLEQSKFVFDKLIEAITQLSLLPLSTDATVTVAVPLAFT